LFSERIKIIVTEALFCKCLLHILGFFTAFYVAKPRPKQTKTGTGWLGFFENLDGFLVQWPRVSTASVLLHGLANKEGLVTVHLQKG
jgi:hypothetical protein